MDVTGKSLVLGTFLLGAAMAGGAWWFHYASSDRAAKFWGGDDATLLVQSPRLELLHLGPPGDRPETDASEGPASPNLHVADRVVVRKSDLSDARGLVHFRHALTQDSNYVWQPRLIAASDFDAAFALRFSSESDELVVLLNDDFTTLGRLSADGQEATLVDCPKMAPALRQYLTEVKAL
ncbi:MAG: hypothetical protein AAF961_07360 [Planctomycetota bacterium]